MLQKVNQTPPSVKLMPYAYASPPASFFRFALIFGLAVGFFRDADERWLRGCESGVHNLLFVYRLECTK